ncbi:hypothetical protein DM02DRAFT_636385 [Periconia macrospinosa]|uniref:Uncharacterized protein n=1 Tax=Periconia macrospinosa TaxID=97972 RepID=A0A2V1D1B9_9PLEO|nr:hypothetical protein DM02DRAFT_636385 [Periconia macrospinosa]
MEMYSLDPVTAKLVIELQLEGVYEILSELPAGSDEHAAFRAIKTSFQDIIQVLKGQCCAQNLLKTGHVTQLQFERLIWEWRQAIKITILLVSLADHLPPELDNFQAEGFSDEHESALYCTSTIVNSIENVATSQGYVLLSLHFENDGDANIKTMEEREYQNSSISKPSPSKGKRKAIASPEGVRPTYRVCSACMKQFPRFDLAELKCKREDDVGYHAYCRRCLIDLFEFSLKDTTLLRPQCCGVRIPYSHVFIFSRHS